MHVELDLVNSSTGLSKLRDHHLLVKGSYILALLNLLVEILKRFELREHALIQLLDCLESLLADRFLVV